MNSPKLAFGIQFNEGLDIGIDESCGPNSEYYSCDTWGLPIVYETCDVRF